MATLARAALLLALALCLPGAQPKERAAEPAVLTLVGDWLQRWFSELGAGVHERRAPGTPMSLAIVMPFYAHDEGRLGAGAPAQPPRARTGSLPPTIDTLETNVSPTELVAMFRAYLPEHPELPPVLLPGVAVPAPAPPPSCAASTPPPGPSPLPIAPPAPTRSRPSRGPRKYLPPGTTTLHSRRRLTQRSSPSTPRFSVSLALRGRLTLPRAGYTEAFNASWHAPSGAMRVDFHDGATSVLRRVDGGKLTRVERRLSRVGAAPRTLCAQLTQDAAAAAPADRAPPALPDLQPFAFAEYVQLEGRRAELWRHSVAGAPGELGGARGEALTFRHEMLLTRGPDDFITPIKYTVEVDSSVLGAGCDGHVVSYDEVVAREPSMESLRAELGACDVIESTADLARVDPLREFTLSARDPRHDDILISYTKKFARKYTEVEEAVRKNVLTQSTRYSEAGNRMGASFSLGLTSISDRLPPELAPRPGAPPRAPPPPEPFPYTPAQVRRLHDALPEEFDWQVLGGVTPVRFQGGCSSAFAAAGAVEGALFGLTGRLVPLSEQAFIDCSEKYGGRACDASEIAAAYGYAMERGFVALNKYPYTGHQEQTCRDREMPSVVHVDGYVQVPSQNISALKVAIKEHSPSVVIIDLAEQSFKNYVGGIYEDRRCSVGAGESRQHALVAVGWGAHPDGEFLVLKNSHSAGWGEAGFMRLRSGACGALALASYPRLQRRDVRLDAA